MVTCLLAIHVMSTVDTLIELTQDRIALASCRLFNKNVSPLFCILYYTFTLSESAHMYLIATVAHMYTSS